MHAASDFLLYAFQEKNLTGQCEEARQNLWKPHVLVLALDAG